MDLFTRFNPKNIDDRQIDTVSYSNSVVDSKTGDESEKIHFSRDKWK